MILTQFVICGTGKASPIGRGFVESDELNGRLATLHLFKTISGVAAACSALK